ncbi:MAG: serine protease [Firmicutes bacterium]|nr:serine protease [Bacillota bacterium]
MPDDKHGPPAEANPGGANDGGENEDLRQGQNRNDDNDGHAGDDGYANGDGGSYDDDDGDSFADDDGDGDSYDDDDGDGDSDDDDNGYEDGDADDYDDYLEDGYEDDRDKDYPAAYDLEYLKQLPDDDDDDWEAESAKAAKPPWLRLVALGTVLIFFALAFVVSWAALPFPLADLVNRSLELQKGGGVRQLQAPVVQINVVARQGAAIGAENKSGTGFNISPEGLIVTNRHVIEGALNMTITFSNGKIYKAQSWHTQSDYDLAVIKLQGENLPVAPVNQGGYPQIGEQITVVGNPLGLNKVVADGTVDGYLRVGDSPGPVFSIDVPVYPGNSGSPVFNSSGQVIGVVFANYQKEVNGQTKTCGLSVPIRFLKTQA